MAKKNVEDKTLFYIFLAVIGVALVLEGTLNSSLMEKNKGISEASGAAYKEVSSGIWVSNYGVSNYPLAKYANKVQTMVKLRNDIVSGLSDAGKVIDYADKIVQATNMVRDLKGAALEKVTGVSIPPTSIEDGIFAAAGYLTSYFKDSTSKCLKNLKSYYKGEAEFVIVSDLVFRAGSYCDDWLFGYARHRYLDKKTGKLMCTDDTQCLFSIEMGTGKMSKSCTDWC